MLTVHPPVRRWHARVLHTRSCAQRGRIVFTPATHARNISSIRVVFCAAL
jgi:hypothetical protein